MPTHCFAQLSGIRLHYVTCGEGPLLILLHGFPDFWRIWRRQIPVLAEYFRVVAVDLPGYNQSDRPDHARSYRMERVSAQIAELIVQLGEESALVAGHDWGGGVAWTLAALHPQLVRKVAILNCPHPSALLRQMWTNPRQLRAAWYILFYQLPWLPEWLMSRNLEQWLRSVYHCSTCPQGGGGPQGFTEQDIDEGVRALAQPGAVKAALDYYRAGIRYGAPRLPRVTIPLLLLWGELDGAMLLDSARASARYAVGPFAFEIVDRAGHWVQVDAAERVNRRLLEYFSPAT